MPEQTAEQLQQDTCPVCRSDRYLNKNLKLLVSPCFHKMCENCINRLFTIGPNPCPICKQTLKKSNFVEQTFEDLYVEKEVMVRKKVGKYFNKRLEDFNGDLRAYNDYLEEVEEIMFNLANDVDVNQTNERIQKFRQENKDIIAANVSKQMHEEKSLSQKLEKEKKERQMRKELYIFQAHEEAKARLAEREGVIQQLASSTDRSASEVVASSLERIKSLRNEYGAVVGVGSATESDEDEDGGAAGGGLEDASDPMYEDPPYLVVREIYQDPWTMELQRNKAARGGGFLPVYCHSRALNEAFSGLFYLD
ncbi:CDK-activating kinase assembly factor MAT1-domain-containing protein [Cladochytrium replicatum]|nr:CDK-activating kinase assembly factor MAT1-domain-containing protein [Cladochytrium replicatum]